MYHIHWVEGLEKVTRPLKFCGLYTHLSKWPSHARHLNQAEVQLWHVSYFFVQEMCLRVSRIYLGRNMKCGSLQAPSRSPFREMEWKNSTDGAISYPSENPGLGFLLLISSHPFSLHFPRLLRMHVYLCRLWLGLIYGYVDVEKESNE